MLLPLLLDSGITSAYRRFFFKGGYDHDCLADMHCWPIFRNCPCTIVEGYFFRRLTCFLLYIPKRPLRNMSSYGCCIRSDLQYIFVSWWYFVLMIWPGVADFVVSSHIYWWRCSKRIHFQADLILFGGYPRPLRSLNTNMHCLIQFVLWKFLSNSLIASPLATPCSMCGAWLMLYGRWNNFFVQLK